MVSLRTILLGLLMLGTVGYGGLKGYLYYSVKQDIDKGIQSLWPFVKIEYGGLATALDGTISVKAIQIKPYEVEDVVRVEAFDISTPGLNFLFNAKKKFTQGDIPEYLSFDIQGITLDLNGELLALLKDVAYESGRVDSGSDVLCGSVGGVPIFQLHQLGFDTFTANATFGYKYDKDTSQLRTFVAGEEVGIDKTRFEMTWNVPEFGKVALSQIRSARFISADFEFVDAGFRAKQNAYCAQQAESSAEAYTDGVEITTGREFSHTFGITFGPELRQAYRRLLEPGGKLHISAQPMAPVDPWSLGLFTSEDLIDLLNVAVVVNNQPVNDLSFRVAQKASTEVGFGSRLLNRLPALKDYTDDLLASDMEYPVEETTIASQPQTRKEFQIVSTNALPKHIGEDIRIYTSSGQVRKGRLARISNNEAVVSWRLKGGQMSAIVPIDRIKKAEVLIKKTL